MSVQTRSAQMSSIAWKVAAAVWALVIFYLSTGGWSLSSTGRFLAGGLGLLHLTLSTPSFEILHFCVRKAAHLTEYAIFGILLCKSSEEPPIPWLQRLLGCFLIVAVYSLTDEYHQSFVPGRTPSLTDCGIDSIGGAMGILLYYVNHIRLRVVCPSTLEVHSFGES